MFVRGGAYVCVYYNSLTSDIFQIILAICPTTRIYISLMSSTTCPIKLSDHVAIDDFYPIISANLSSLVEMMDYMFAEMIRQKPLIGVLSL